MSQSKWKDFNTLITHIVDTNKDKVEEIGYRTNDNKNYSVVLVNKRKQRLVVHALSEELSYSCADLAATAQRTIDRWLAGKRIENSHRDMVFQVVKERINEVFADDKSHPFFKYKLEFIRYFYNKFYRYGQNFAAVTEAFYLLTRSAITRTRGDKGMYLTFLGGASDVYLEGFNKAFGLVHPNAIPRVEAKPQYHMVKIMKSLDIPMDTLAMVLKINELHKSFSDKIIIHYHPEDVKEIVLSDEKLLAVKEVPEEMKEAQVKAKKRDAKVKEKEKEAKAPADLKSLDLGDLANLMMGG